MCVQQPHLHIQRSKHMKTIKISVLYKALNLIIRHNKFKNILKAYNESTNIVCFFVNGVRQIKLETIKKNYPCILNITVNGLLIFYCTKMYLKIISGLHSNFILWFG